MRNFIKFLKTKDLRGKALFTIFIVFLFRVGSLVPTPGVKVEVVKQFMGNNPFFSLYDLFSGGGMSSFAFFALGISPYITASIILQLLTVGFESLKVAYEGGEVGRKKQKLHTKLLAIVLAIFQSTGISIGLISQLDMLSSNKPWFILVPIISLTLGAIVVMWLADLIDKKGIGNGVSFMIFVSIISNMPETTMSIISGISSNQMSPYIVGLLLIGTLLLVILTVYVQECVRKIPIQYAKRMSNTKLIATNSSYLPLKLNQSGVMPVIFASTLLSVPQVLIMLNIDFISNFVQTWLNPSSGTKGLIVYILLQAFLIFAFNYFTLITMFNIEEICDNLRNHGGFVNGIRPGKPTVEYITNIATKLSFVGALFLIFISTVPITAGVFSNIPMQLGGTSLLIAVSVAIETVKKVNTELTVRNHKGFLG